MKNILLILACVATVATLASAYSKEKDCEHEQNSAMKRFVNRNTAITGIYLYRHLLKYPKQSYTIVTLPIFCIIAHLAQHIKGDEYQKLLEFMDFRNKDEMQKVLSAAVSHINHESDTSSKLTFIALRDRSQEFTRSYVRGFYDICNGESGRLDYDCPEKSLEEVIAWFAHQSSTYSPIPMSSTEMFDEHDKKAVDYATYMHIVASFDHEANPNALIDIDFEMEYNKTIKFPSLYGNGYFKYAKLCDLDAEVIQFYLKGGRHFGVFYYPRNADNLVELMEKLQDPKVFYGGLDRAVWQCLKIHMTIGHADVANDLFEFVPELCLNSTKFERVFKSHDPAHVNYGLQQLHLIGDTEVRKGQLNSKWCPDKNLKFVKMNHACAYYVLDSNGMIIYAGLLYGPQDYTT